MYIPSSFREERTAELHSLIRSHSFGSLVSVIDGEPYATHLPFLLDPDRGPNGVLIGHLARANPHGRAFGGPADSLAIFQGPHAYISPEWYAEPVSVPTWNYVAVHAYGVPVVVSDPDEVRRLLARMVGTFEASVGQGWSMDRLPEEYIEKMTGAIVAFEMPITRLEGKWKLGQGRSRADREGVAAGLRRGGRESAGMAALVEQTLSDEMR